MPKNPKANMEKLDRGLNSWRTLKPEKRFGGMTVADFEVFVNDSRLARVTVSTVEDQLTDALTNRENKDEVGLGKLQLIVAGVLADPEEGADSALYEAMGYIRKSERKSGLTRKKKIPKPTG